jgi:serine/threonine-protein kinase HipA
VSDTEVEVCIDAPNGGTAVVGRLFLHRRRGAESATFRYDSDWIGTPGAYPIDPQLPLTSGSLHTGVDQQLFRAFADSAPDRWGVELVLRHERRRAHQDGTAPRSFAEADFLLAVRDQLRQGALRLRDPVRGNFLAPGGERIPHLVDLPRLLGASTKLEQDAETDDELRVLLEAGSSLGGARPKAHVMDAGKLLIAKFPRPTRDPWSVIVWEQIALEMAAAGGIRAARSRLVDVAGRAVILLERFDRTAKGGRIGYVSALTMLEARDNDRRSYTDIAEAIETSSPSATEDLRELWRRVAFSILISNADDHLRNHGFLRLGPGWTLSPAFDLNPAPDSAASSAPRSRRRATESRISVCSSVGRSISASLTRPVSCDDSWMRPTPGASARSATASPRRRRASHPPSNTSSAKQRADWPASRAARPRLNPAPSLGSNGSRPQGRVQTRSPGSRRQSRSRFNGATTRRPWSAPAPREPWPGGSRLQRGHDPTAVVRDGNSRSGSGASMMLQKIPGSAA